MTYDERRELRDYVIRHLWSLLTDLERKRVAFEADRVKQAFRDWFLERAERRRAGLSEVEWRPPGQTPGYAAFVDGVVERVIRENDAAAPINRCPNCNAVLRSPQAKLCLWCGHSQYRAS
jgi:hypothetical protein